MAKCIGLSKPLKVVRVIQVVYSFIINEPAKILRRVASFEPESFTARGFFEPEM